MNPTRDVPDERSFPRWALPRTMPPHESMPGSLDHRQNRKPATGDPVGTPMPPHESMPGSLDHRHNRKPATGDGPRWHPELMGDSPRSWFFCAFFCRRELV